MKIRIIKTPSSYNYRNSRKWKHGDGGNLFAPGGPKGENKKTHQEVIVDRANQKLKNGEVYNNYEQAVDASWATPFIAPWTRFASSIDNVHISAGGSNCTLNATQWIDPNTPIMSARTITKDPNRYGYVQIPEDYTVAGDLVIADDKKGSYHTMLLTDFSPEEKAVYLNGKEYNVKEGDPMVSYSKGRYNPNNLVKDVPLSGYIDQSHGKENVRYYRNVERGTAESFLPTITVTPNENYIYTNDLIDGKVFSRPK